MKILKKYQNQNKTHNKYNNNIILIKKILINLLKIIIN